VVPRQRGGGGGGGGDVEPVAARASSPAAAARTRLVVAAGSGSLRRTAARVRQVQGLSAKEEDTIPTNCKKGQSSSEALKFIPDEGWSIIG